MAILAKMVYLAKMAELALNRQNRQTANKNSNEMAKGPFGKWPFGKWRFLRKWRICRKWQNWRLIAKIAKLLTKIQMRWHRSPLESGDFDENCFFGPKGRNGD